MKAKGLKNQSRDWDNLEEIEQSLNLGRSK